MSPSRPTSAEVKAAVRELIKLHGRRYADAHPGTPDIPEVHHQVNRAACRAILAQNIKRQLAVQLLYEAHSDVAYGTRELIKILAKHWHMDPVDFLINLGDQ